jgi:hypothetical protein
MIELGEHKTRDGRRVVVHEIKPQNDAGQKVTFPVKGTIYSQTPSGRLKKTFAIWDENGRHNVFVPSKLDITE